MGGRVQGISGHRISGDLSSVISYINIFLLAIYTHKKEETCVFPIKALVIIQNMQLRIREIALVIMQEVIVNSNSKQKL